MQKYINIKLISPDAEIAMIVFFLVVVSLKKEKKEEPVPVTLCVHRILITMGSNKSA